jgi:predicted glycosyltransferase
MANRIAFPCATTIMIPEFLSLDKVRKQWANPRKVIRYPGVKEAIYLFRFENAFHGGRNHRPVGTVFIRPEPSTAQYYSGGINFMDDLILKLKERYSVVVMPRDHRQAEHYRQERFDRVAIPPKPLSLEAVIDECSLFIGAGGTMTREAAVLGIPTISTYQDELLDVDRYLIAQGRMVHETRLTADRVREFMENTQGSGPSTELLDKGREAYHLILRHLLNGHAASVGHKREESTDDGIPSSQEQEIRIHHR